MHAGALMSIEVQRAYDEPAGQEVDASSWIGSGLGVSARRTSL
jgi:hypothetical protein